MRPALTRPQHGVPRAFNQVATASGYRPAPRRVGNTPAGCGCGCSPTARRRTCTRRPPARAPAKRRRRARHVVPRCGGGRSALDRSSMAAFRCRCLRWLSFAPAVSTAAPAQMTRAVSTADLVALEQIYVGGGRAAGCVRPSSQTDNPQTPPCGAAFPPRALAARSRSDPCKGLRSLVRALLCLCGRV
jgi:hypothetical protein